MTVRRSPHLDIYRFRKFDLETLTVESEFLKKNPLKDPHVRHNPVLLPKKSSPKNGFPVIFILPGLTGAGPQSFSKKAFEENTPQMIDRAVAEKKAPVAIYVFVDAMTFWGGSQYLNSEGCGRYEDYLMEELVPAVRAEFPASADANLWCVTGTSSGGYGALHLASRYPEVFGIPAAMAPDSDFDTSLLPEFYRAAPTLIELDLAGAKQELIDGKLLRRKNGHEVLNVVAMAYCYAGKKNPRLGDFPVDLATGELKTELWKKWREHDPVVFLPKRLENLKKLRKIYLDVGRQDQFHLFFGARRIAKYCASKKLPLKYGEFEGGHFDMAPRRLVLWKWLESLWKTQTK